jgi:mRNA-degrading endonuclease YafQ of YafQ-DinJ toxin-antitoxin module
MNIEFTESFKRKIQKLKSKDPQLISSLKKQFKLFASNPYYPSLRLHKLQGKRSEQYAIYIKGDLRALFIKSKQVEDTFIFFDLVTHDEY